LSHPQGINSLFAILATALNFGLHLARGSAPSAIFGHLCPFITSAIELLSQNLVAAIGSSISQDGFEFADEFSLEMVRSTTAAFLENSRTFHIPEQIVQVIIVETCAYCDVLLFNVIIDTATEFTDNKMTALLQKVRRVQQLFNCLPTNFEAAFPVLIEFISQTKGLWAGDVIVKSDRMRSIIERCPGLQLPADLTLDEIGSRVESTSLLKLPPRVNSFTFSYEWLYTQDREDVA
jgi:hypothetical protein